MPEQSHLAAEQGKHKWLAMLGIGMGVFMATLDSSIVNISLPTLQEVFHTSFATIQWVVLSYVLVLTSLMLAVARLGDMIDKKKIYLAGLALFTTFSLLCGLSPGVGWLITFRAFQGLGATMMQALGIAIVTEIFPASMRGRALGIMGSVVSMGIAVGPPLGGILIGAFGWHSVFLVNVPVGIATLFVVARLVPNSRASAGGQRFDLAGALLLLFTLINYALGMTVGQVIGFGAPTTLALLAVAAVGVGALLFVEQRVQQPMIDLSLFQNILFGISLLMGFMVFILLAANFILPFFLELVQNYPPEQVGLLMMAMPVIMGVVAPAAGSLSDRFGPRIISLVGLLILVGGSLLMSSLSADITPLGFVVRLAPFGIGLGMFQSPNNSAIMGAAPRHRLGIASGLLSLSRTLGQTTGLPLMGAIFSARVVAMASLADGSSVTSAPAQALVAGVEGAYRYAALMAAGATVLAISAFAIEKKLKKRY